MSDTLSALRYARAIWGLASDKGLAERVLDDMDSIAQTLDESPELQGVLNDPTVTGSRKLAVMLQVWKDAHTITRGLMEVLSANGRHAIIGQVASKFRELREESLQQEQAVVYSTTALPSEAMEAIRKRLQTRSSKEVVLRNELKPELLGGFVVRWGDMQYDASIAQKLSSLKREFTNNR